MLVAHKEQTVALTPGEECVFGRSPEADLHIDLDSGDLTVSRRAGLLVFERYVWTVANIGRRSFFLVEGGREVELGPGGALRNSLPILHDGSWIRVPTDAVDAAIELSIPAAERPETEALMAMESGSVVTKIENQVRLTDNERLSVLAVYEGYLRLPPAYRREPNSYRAAGRRLGVEEGKVKADIRRVQEKVARAGGGLGGGSRSRDALVGWLLSRRVVTRTDVRLLPER